MQYLFCRFIYWWPGR